MNQNGIHEEIKRRLNSGSACFHSVQIVSLPHLISKIIKMKLYRTVILHVALCGCETWPLMLKEKLELRVFGCLMLVQIFGPMGEGVAGMEGVAS
jgi:hypothetical protein